MAGPSKFIVRTSRARISPGYDVSRPSQAQIDLAVKMGLVTPERAATLDKSQIKAMIDAQMMRDRGHRGR